MLVPICRAISGTGSRFCQSWWQKSAPRCRSACVRCPCLGSPEYVRPDRELQEAAGGRPDLKSTIAPSCTKGLVRVTVERSPTTRRAAPLWKKARA